MGSLGILLFLWVAKRGMYLEEDISPLLFPCFAATPSFAVSQSGGECRLKTPLCIA